MAKPDKDELKFIADRLVERVWQNDEGKRGLATQCASVALAGIQDYTAQRYMETTDQFDGRSLVQRWLNRHTLLEEARASVALDGGTHTVEELPDGAYTRKAPKDPNLVGKFLAKQEADGAEVVDREEFEDGWKDNL